MSKHIVNRALQNNMQNTLALEHAYSREKTFKITSDDMHEIDEDSDINNDNQ